VISNHAATSCSRLGRGWEYILKQELVGNARKWGEEAAEKLKAKPVEVGRYDLVLHPTHLWLTIHESIGHPTELDRAMGYEANYAGTSFVAPPEKVLGTLKYGPDFMNIQGRPQPGRRVRHDRYDDDGVKPEEFLIIKNGCSTTTRRARARRRGSSGTIRKMNRRSGRTVAATRTTGAACSSSVCRTSRSCPGTQDRKWEDLISATDNGIAIVGDGSFSIDQQRYNAQFGGQVFYEIKGGKITGMLKDVAYQMKTTNSGTRWT
jgi:TldD protein